MKLTNAMAIASPTWLPLLISLAAYAKANNTAPCATVNAAVDTMRAAGLTVLDKDIAAARLLCEHIEQNSRDMRHIS